jgi:hypothetical protein
MSGSGRGSSHLIVALGALVEVATGLAFIVDPAPLVDWLLGATLTAGLAPLARVVGVALVSLGVACWPGRSGGGGGLLGLLLYNLAIAAYLTLLRTLDHAGGRLLWPAVALHAVLALLLIRSRFAAGPDAGR